MSDPKPPPENEPEDLPEPSSPVCYLESPELDPAFRGSPGKAVKRPDPEVISVESSKT